MIELMDRMDRTARMGARPFELNIPLEFFALPQVVRIASQLRLDRVNRVQQTLHFNNFAVFLNLFLLDIHMGYAILDSSDGLCTASSTIKREMSLQNIND